MEMLGLILANHRSPFAPFSPHLLMAIFWEESLFSNVRQIGRGGGAGPAVGFGQVEKQELPKLSTQKAQTHGYFVPGMHAGISDLPDHLSVQVSSCMLLHLFFASQALDTNGKVAFALRGYSGNRSQIVGGWLACETALKKLPFTLFQIINSGPPLRLFEDQVLTALALSRPFNRDAMVTVTRNGRPTQVKFREVLFPLYWFFPAADVMKMATFLPPGNLLRQGSRESDVGFLQKLLNAQRNMGPVQDLQVDSIFGPKTNARVRLYQRMTQLTEDGIVGQRTRGKLIPA